MVNLNLPELGPLLKEDAELLQSIIRMTDPKVVIEFGTHRGTSARAMLDVLDQDAKLISYDNTIGDSIAIHDSRFTFKPKSQDEFEPVENVDFVFLDASHEITRNKSTFEQVLPCLKEGAIIAIHDTGVWAENWWNFHRGHKTKNGHWAHCPDEIEFVEWLKTIHPEFNQIHLHSLSKVRHGITLLQKNYKLEI